MRPIMLKIKGLNSFREEQLIDFGKLTSRGLFGIFGPTGSGKTSILDGITLSLYGDISRSTKEFINANEEAAYVSFEFEIVNSVTKRYRVEREFRRSKTGGVTTKNARMLAFENGEYVILEDRPAKVDDQCEAIIGLTREDFTRTVVLPQGKFSDFLKLKNKDRGEMLERLFNLQQYGDELTAKLSRHAKIVRQKDSELSGQLRAYADVTPENLSAGETDLALKEVELTKAQKDFETIEKQTAEAQEIWQFQQDLQIGLEKRAKHLEAAEGFQKMEKTIEGAESAGRLMPQINEYERLQASVLNLETQEAAQKIERDRLRAGYALAKTEFETVQQEREERLATLQADDIRFQNALGEKERLEVAAAELEKMAVQLEAYGVKRQTLESQRLADETLKGKLEEQLDDFLKQLEPLKLTAVYKTQLSSLHSAWLQLASKTEQHSKWLEKHAGLTLAHQNLKHQFELSEKEKSEWQGRYEASLLQLKTWEAQRPGDAKDLIERSVKLQQSKTLWARFDALTLQIQNNQGLIAETTTAQTAIVQEISQLEKEKAGLEAEIAILGLENQAVALRQLLKDQQPCPVCGSLDHPIETASITPLESLGLQAVGDQTMDALELALKQQDLKIRDLERIQIGSETKKTQLEEHIQQWLLEIESLGASFKESSVKSLEEAYEAFEKELTLYEARLNAEQETNRGLLENLNAAEKRRALAENEFKTGDAQLRELTEELNALESVIDKEARDLTAGKEALGIEDISTKFGEMQLYEKQAELLEKEIHQLRGTLSDLAIKLKNASDLQKDLENKQLALQTQRDIGIRQTSEKRLQLESAVGVLDQLEIKLVEVKREIESLRQRYDGKLQTLNTLDDQLRKMEEVYQTTVNQLDIQKDNGSRAWTNVQALLRASNFEDIDAIKTQFIEPSALAALKNQLQQHKDELQRINGAIVQLETKLEGRKIDQEVYQAIISAKIEAQERLKMLSEERIAMKTSLDQLKQRFDLMKDLIADKAALDRQLGHIADLEKLFQGKRFVAYIAANQLKYISGKASEQLFDVSLGNFGLETDEEGNFMIRDYKNGGALRDPSSLSGGETFMVSLALALALSAQIQLKGTAPLEFFFLDEGFGTLDEETLEVVMSALERLHHERLSIGLISHVESIKNRVPIKLLVSPARAGLGGSKVKIELS